MADMEGKTVAVPTPAWRFQRFRVAGGLGAVLAVLLAAWFGWRATHRPAPIVIAFAGSLTGGAASLGDEARIATQIYLDEVNAAGGIEGHEVVLQSFDDQSRPGVAKANVGAVLDSPAVAVLGHSLSATSVAAGSGYEAGHIAALTGVASADEVTQNNPYYFRALSPNTVQVAFLAEYIRTVLLSHSTLFLRAPDIDLVSSDDPYGRSFRTGLVSGNGVVAPKTFMVQTGDGVERSAVDLAERLAQEPEPRMIVLGVAPDVITPVLRAIRRRGIRSLVILASGAADDNFATQFVNDPEEIDSPGFFTDNVFAIAPIIMDNTGQLGQELAAQYLELTGRRAGWNAAAGQDAARVMVEALRRAHVGARPETRQADREAVRTALAGIDSPAQAVPGNNGPLYFNAAREMPRPLRYGFFHEGRFVSAPLQLVRVQNPDLVDIDHETEQGHIVQIGEEFYWLQRVVYTGIELTHLSHVDVKDGTFTAEFYLWMRYAGTDDLPTEVKFSDFSGRFNPAQPLESRIEDGLRYKLYQPSGVFKASFDLHDYPFDRQALLIRLQSQSHPLQEIAYVIDSFGLQLDKPGRDSAASEAFHDLQLWQAVAVHPFVDAFSISSTLGEPALFDTPNRVEYAGFDTAIVL
jgi:branched-chain amino acid transport system substrate-binding protein